MKLHSKERQKALGQDLRRHLCSLVALAYRYQSGIWGIDTARRDFHNSTLRQLNTAVKEISRQVSDLGVELPRTADDIQRYTYVEIEVEEMNWVSAPLPQDLAETRLQKALSFTKSIASVVGVPEVAETLATLTKQSKERVRTFRQLAGPSSNEKKEDHKLLALA